MTATTIPRSEAIARMAKGEPVETREERGVEWNPTMWRDFELLHPEFRIPPEPRREAREWWLNAYEPHSTALTVFDSQKEADRAALKLRSEVIHVREVLPDEVTLQMLGRDDARLALHKAIHAIEFGNKTDDKLIIAQLADQGVYLAKEVKS